MMHACSLAQAYSVSKVLVEKATCAFAEEKGLSLVTVCPGVVVGGAPATKVKTSVPEVLSLLSGEAAVRISAPFFSDV